MVYDYTARFGTLYILLNYQFYDLFYNKMSLFSKHK